MLAETPFKSTIETISLPQDSVGRGSGGPSGTTLSGGVFIALGSNLGDRAWHIRSALRELGDEGSVNVLTSSSLHETAPVGGPVGQPQFLNAVAEVDTRLSPAVLLQLMHRIEVRHGRARLVPDGPRTLDLDLLLYRDEIFQNTGLTVPHPRMWQREFVLAPLLEICGPERFARLRERCGG